MQKELSRRRFAQLLGGAAAVAAVPRIAWAAAQDVVRLSANENPYGPSPAAIRAATEALKLAWRYPDEAMDSLALQIAEMHGVSSDEVLLGNGSSEILKLAASAALDGTHKLVMADPSFEAMAIYARAIGAPIVKIPLDAKHAHDAERMLAAAKGAGVLYVCNPNNPTGTITPNIRRFVDTPTLVVIDEAYHHYAESAQYESAIPLVKSSPNLIVVRTFSKIYALAGLRIGYAVAQKQTIQRLAAHQPWDSINAAALAAAGASLRDAEYLALGRKRNRETRAWLVAEAKKLGYETLPSETNFVMIDLQREVRPVIAAMRAQGVYPGRVFPAMPKHLRVSIGTPGQMQRFVDVLKRV